MPKEVHSVLCDLDVISNIPPYYKLNVRTQGYSYVGSWTGIFSSRVLRALSRETGDTCTFYLDATVARALLTAKTFPSYRELIVTRLTACVPAVERLLEVYSDQVLVCAKLRTMLVCLEPDRIRAALEQECTSHA
jgi:hypothetical protein